MKKYIEEDINKILLSYGLAEIKNIKFIDSSHGTEDIRHNYILDKKYILRVNSAPVFSEQRLMELNVLIKHYNEFGVKAPYFLCDRSGKYLKEINNTYVYLSEYLDYITADKINDNRRSALVNERIVLVAGYAEKYKDIDLIDTMSMYSIFDLSPYDKLAGIDEKQENLNELVAALRKIKRPDLAEKYENLNYELREKLKKIYKKLPRCVFQGDENFSNICVDENGHMIGLFDFNMSGTDVIANYLANLAFLGGFDYTDEVFLKNDAGAIYDMALKSYKENTKLIEQNYSFTAMERTAYELYSKIVMISGYINVCAFKYYLEKAETQEKAIELLSMIATYFPMQKKDNHILCYSSVIQPAVETGQ